MLSQPMSFSCAIDKMAAAMPALRLEDCLGILRAAEDVAGVVLASLATEGSRFDLHSVTPQSSGRTCPQTVAQQALQDLLQHFADNGPVFVQGDRFKAHWREWFPTGAAELGIFLPLRSGTDLIGFLHVALAMSHPVPAGLVAARLSQVQPVLSQALQRRRAWELLQNATDTGIQPAGDRVFESTARMLAATLNADVAFVGRIAFDFSVSMDSLAAADAGGTVANFSYPLGQRPDDCARSGARCSDPHCQSFSRGHACFVPTRVEELQPAAPWLERRGLSHWFGLPIAGASGSLLGVVAVMFRAPPAGTDRIEAVLRLFVERVAMELRRLVAEEEKERLSAVVEATTDLVATVLPSGYITYLNPAGRSLLGLGEQGLSSLSVSRLLGRQPDREAFARGVLRHADAYGSWKEDGVLQRMDGGGEIDVAQMVVPIRNERGRTTSYAVVTRDISRRKAQESRLLETIAALSRSESLLDGVVNNSNSLIYVKDCSGRHILVNGACLRHLRLTREEVLGKTDHDLFPRETAELYRTNDRRVMESGEALQFEENHAGREFLSVKFPLLDAQARPYAVCGITTDITERNRHVAEKLASERKFRAVFDGANDAILILRGDRFVDCNERALELFGRRREDIVGSTPAMLSPPLQRDGSRSDESAARRMRDVADGRTQRFEWLGLRADGSTIDLDVSVNLIELNQEPHLLALVRDISERVQAERKEQEQYNFIRQLLDAIPNPVFFKDVDGRYLGCNAAYEAFVGRAQADLLGRRPHDTESREVAELYADIDRELLQNPGTRVHEATMTHADGSARNVLLYKATFLRTDGSVGGLVGVTLDITERKRAERENLELEARLRQAQKMESIGHLTGGIAHDFNNILAAILGFTELAQMDAPAATPQRLLLDEIERASLRARDLVAQLLTFSRRGEHTTDRIMIGPVVNEVVKLLRSTLPKGISVTVEMPEALPMARISPVYLHQVLMNLGINARDAMNGHGRLAIRIAQADLARFTTCASCHNDFEGSYLMLSVRDDGEGIRPELVPHIFDPFFTTKEVGSGTGLGLSVLHGIVHSVGGHVQVDSRPGAGTEFRIYLPVAHEAPEARPTAADAGRSRQSIGGRILLVDDEAQVAAAQRKLLEAHGCAVASFTDPAAALARFRADPAAFDLLITDQAMPGMTGIELVQSITRQRPGMPAMLCSGYLGKATKDAARAAGIGSVLQKPVTAAVLLETVTEILACHPDAIGSDCAEETP